MTDPWLGDQIARIGWVRLDLSAQRADMYAHRIVRGPRRTPPHHGDDLVEGHRPPSFARQEFEDSELGRRKAHFPCALCDPAALDVNARIRSGKSS